MMKIPPRRKTGSRANHKRALAFQRRLHVLGQEYRRTVPKCQRSYKRWCEFLYEHEPLLMRRGSELIYGASIPFALANYQNGIRKAADE